MVKELRNYSQTDVVLYIIRFKSHWTRFEIFGLIVIVSVVPLTGVREYLAARAAE